MERSIKEFNKQANSLSESGYSIIENLARTIMDADKRIKTFAMANGLYYFCDFHNCIIDTKIGRSGPRGLYEHFEKELFKPLDDFIREHDERFDFTKMPLRLVRIIDIVKEW